MPELSGSRIADLTGRAWRTVKAKLERAGVRPIRQERNANLYDSVAALEAIFSPERPAGFENEEFTDQRQRLAAAQAEKQEMENALRSGQLADVRDVEQAWADMILACRAKLLVLPGKLAPQLQNVAQATVIEARIRAEVYQALNELGQSEQGEDSEPSNRGEHAEDHTASTP